MEPKTILRWLIPLLSVVVLVWPGWVFVHHRGGFEALAGAGTTRASQWLFPLFGLYAFTFLWFQLMLGSLMPWWRRLWPGVEKWHRGQGMVVFLFALTHPLLLAIGIGLDRFWSNDFIAPSQRIFLLFGKIALMILVFTVGTALLRRTAWFRQWWRRIHVLNYIIFLAAWFHAWNLGSDIQSSELRWLWLGYGISALIAVTLRLLGLTWPRNTPVMKQPLNPVRAFVPVARLENIQAGHPLCVQVHGQAIALFRLGEEVFALNNACSHAGGSLCDGLMEGEYIECPRHYSRFNVKTGEPIDGPATVAQTTYQVQIQDGTVMVAIV